VAVFTRSGYREDPKSDYRDPYGHLGRC